MPKAARLEQHPGIHGIQNKRGSRPKKKIPAATPKSTIQVTLTTKMTLDQIKETEHLETYDEAIGFLFRKQRKNLPSTAGKFPSGGPFERETGDDPYRVPS
ncbi:MAG: hypothetical protein LUQ31_07775 [Methanoregula sp.]|nr:hypothetical protein [Methanoregula sp.]